MNRKNVERKIADRGGGGGEPTSKADDGPAVDRGVEGLTAVDPSELYQAMLEAKARGESVHAGVFAYIKEVRSRPGYEPHWHEKQLEAMRLEVYGASVPDDGPQGRRGSSRGQS
jgi:hypothetical protein